MRTLAALTRLDTPARWMARALVTILLLLMAAGCSNQPGPDMASATVASSEGGSSSAMVANTPESGVAESAALESATTPTATEPATPAPAAVPAAPVHRITLSDHGCVQFEPQWTNVRVGESITWHSDLDQPIRIYVSPGVFKRDHFLLRPGATVRSGPVRLSGRWAFWTEPTACREAPRGVLLSGPGVMVEETFYASAPGVN